MLMALYLNYFVSD